MKLRIFVGAVVLAVVAGVGTMTARGAAAGRACCAEHEASCCLLGVESCCLSAEKPSTQTAIINLLDPVMVNRKIVAGPVLIVHDDAKMARGEPCTTFYRFDPADGPKEELVSFHCKPRRAARAETTKLTTATTDLGVKQLLEYQIAGDSEAHGVPR